MKQRSTWAHFWLGKFTGLGAVTFPSDTMRRPGLRPSHNVVRQALIQPMPCSSRTPPLSHRRPDSQVCRQATATFSYKTTLLP